MKRLLSAFALLAVLAGGAPAWAVPIDSNDKLLIQSNNTGTPGTFLDTSSGAKTVTTVGGATQVPYKFNRSAIFFDDAASAIKVPDHADWDFGTGDFTIETDLMFLATSNDRVIFDRNSANDIMFKYDGSYPGLKLIIGGSIIKNETWTPSLNTWYHVAVVRYSGNVYFYVDGVALGTPTSNSSNISYSSDVYIGDYASGSGRFYGWMKEYRVSNTARYTAGFTPHTEPFTSDSNTKLLLRGNSAASFPLSPWIKVDGTGDYMTIPDAAWQDLGTGDFTIESVVRWNSVGTSTVVEIGNAGATGAKVVYSSSTLQFVVNGSAVISPSFAPVANRNYHIAGVRASGTVYLFCDGQLLGSGANSSNLTGLTNGVRIASDQSSQSINGWIRGIRISNSARYTAAFTPPTTAFTSDANTMFLLNGDVANGTTSFTDASSNGATITVNGNTVADFQEDWRSTIITDSGNTGHKPYVPVTKLAKVDFVSVFGNGSGIFDGSGDRLTLADSADWDFGTGAFTLETWARFDSNSSVVLIDVGAAVSGTAKGVWLRNTGTNIEAYVNSVDFNFPFVPAPNTWYHLAISRSGTGAGLFKGFANGSLLASNTSSGDITGSTEGVTIGKASVFGSGEFDGYLDNVRVSNVARYTATFDPADSDFSSGRKRSTILF